MKTTKSFTIDVELWAEARIKYDNISERINELLKADLQHKNMDNTNAKEKIKNYEAVISSLKAELEIKQRKEAKKKENLKPRPYNPTDDRSDIYDNLPEHMRPKVVRK